MQLSLNLLAQLSSSLCVEIKARGSPRWDGSVSRLRKRKSGKKKELEEEEEPEYHRPR